MGMDLSYCHKKTPTSRGKGSYVLPPPYKWIGAKILIKYEIQQIK